MMLARARGLTVAIALAGCSSSAFGLDLMVEKKVLK